MGLLRRSKDEPNGMRFQMREDLLSIGDEYWIENDAGERIFRVDGKAALIRDTWRLEDRNGNEIATIRERKLSVRDGVRIDIGGREATVKKRLVGMRDRFHVEVERGADLTVKGNFVDHEYEIERDGEAVAQVSKRWLRARDTYGVEVREATDVVLVRAVTVAVDALAHD
jgi:uncharacterized protein YxjI